MFGNLHKQSLKSVLGKPDVSVAVNRPYETYKDVMITHEHFAGNMQQKQRKDSKCAKP